MMWLARFRRWRDRRKNPLPFRQISQWQFDRMVSNQQYRWNRRLGG